MRSEREAVKKSGRMVGLDEYSDYNFIAMFTDKFLGGVIKEGCLSVCDGYEPMWEKLLELRIFSKYDEKQPETGREILYQRCGIGDELMFRTAEDSGLAEEEYFDETQLLDIDEDATSKLSQVGIPENCRKLKATGGGEYVLSITENENAVKIRNYICYSKNTGRAEIVDFRILGFLREGGEIDD